MDDLKFLRLFINKLYKEDDITDIRARTFRRIRKENSERNIKKLTSSLKC